ncbi:MAG: DUF4131 domain-containing protein [Candidatus Eisenbacteria bacterium]
MSGRGALPIAVAFWAGLLLAGHGAGDGHAAATAAWRALATAAVLVVLAAVARPRTGAALVLACALAAGMARGGASSARTHAALAATPADECVVRLCAVACEPPRLDSGDAQVVARVHAGRGLPRGARVRLRLPAGSAAEWGDTLHVLARLERFDGVRVPGGFDARATALASGVLLHGRAFTVRTVPAAAPRTRASPWPCACVARSSARLRRGCRRRRANWPRRCCSATAAR